MLVGNSRQRGKDESMVSDLRRHPDYLRGQTKEWCDQLAAMSGKYAFPWNGIIEGKAAEEALTEKLASAVHGKVLDVGCAHGAYTVRWADLADEVVGFDMTEGFVATANASNRKPNVRYVVGRTRVDGGMPFPDHYFDVAFTKKGPTSWYSEGNRIVRPGGAIILLHPGDGNGEGGELGACFPELFDPPAEGTPTLDRIHERLEASGLTDVGITVLKEVIWIPSPEDVLQIACFGQSERYARDVREACFDQIEAQFEKHADAQGIRTTGFYYLIEAKSSGKLHHK